MIYCLEIDYYLISLIGNIEQEQKIPENKTEVKNLDGKK